MLCAPMLRPPAYPHRTGHSAMEQPPPGRRDGVGSPLRCLPPPFPQIFGSGSGGAAGGGGAACVFFFPAILGEARSWSGSVPWKTKGPGGAGGGRRSRVRAEGAAAASPEPRWGETGAPSPENERCDDGAPRRGVRGCPGRRRGGCYSRLWYAPAAPPPAAAARPEGRGNGPLLLTGKRCREPERGDGGSGMGSGGTRGARPSCAGPDSCAHPSCAGPIRARTPRSSPKGTS